MKRHIPAHRLALTALFAALTAIGAWLRIPTPWSAFTLQVLFVFLAGALLGPGYGALSQAVYVGMGLIGLPVFVSGGGPAYVLQPTFGFLLSYIPAAAVVGRLCRGAETPGFGRIVLACLTGLAVIYAVGLPYMALIVNGYLGGSMGLRDVLWSGMVLFLPYDAVKIALTGVLARTLIPRLRKLRSQ